MLFEILLHTHILPPNELRNLRDDALGGGDRVIGLDTAHLTAGFDHETDGLGAWGRRENFSQTRHHLLRGVYP